VLIDTGLVGIEVLIDGKSSSNWSISSDLVSDVSGSGSTVDLACEVLISIVRESSILRVAGLFANWSLILLRRTGRITRGVTLEGIWLAPRVISNEVSCDNTVVLPVGECHIWVTASAAISTVRAAGEKVSS